MSDVYDVGEVIDRTLITNRALPVYSSPPSAGYNPTPIGTIPKGATAGVVYSYLAADPSKNRNVLWWIFYPDGAGNYLYMPHHEGDFNVQVLEDQGAQSEHDKNNPDTWYERILHQVLPVVAITAVGVAVIRGYFSRGRKL